VPQFDVEVDRIKTQTLHVTTDQIFSTLSSYLGSSYINQFNKFGRVSRSMRRRIRNFRLTERDIANMMVRNQNGEMIPIGTVAKITPSVGPSLIRPVQPLSVRDHRRPAGAGLQLRPVAQSDGAGRRQDPAARHRL